MFDIILGIGKDAIKFISDFMTEHKVLSIIAAITVLSESVAKITGKQFIIVYTIKKLWWVCSIPYKIWMNQQEIFVIIKMIQGEVTYNGGSVKLRDAVEKLDKQNEAQNKLLLEMSMDMKASDEIDTMMKFKLDNTGYLLWANRSYLEYFGFNDSHVRAFGYEDTIAKTDLQEVQVRLRRAIDSSSDFKLECHIVDTDEKPHRCLVRCIPKIDSGKLCGFYGTIEIVKRSN